MAIKTFDWSECTHCQATGYYRNKECPNCKGVGYLFVGLRDKATVETRHFQMDRRKGLA
jgi:DnaJ-class molecular chaperone